MAQVIVQSAAQQVCDVLDAHRDLFAEIGFEEWRIDIGHCDENTYCAHVISGIHGQEIPQHSIGGETMDDALAALADELENVAATIKMLRSYGDATARRKDSMVPGELRLAVINSDRIAVRYLDMHETVLQALAQGKTELKTRWQGWDVNGVFESTDNAGTVRKPVTGWSVEHSRFQKVGCLNVALTVPIYAPDDPGFLPYDKADAAAVQAARRAMEQDSGA